MILRYARENGMQTDIKIGEQPITIGRSRDADVVIPDEKASRIHCGIRLWDGDIVVKDLKSRNGTYLNGERIEVGRLKPGDRIRVGSTVFLADDEVSKGTQTVLREVQDEMSQGKGYATILREIVDTTDSSAKKK